MNPFPRIPAELLDRYLSGRCTPAEVQDVQAVIAKNPDLAILIRGVQQARPVSVADAWQRFDRAHPVPPQVHSGRSRSKGFRLGLSAFAVGALAVAGLISGLNGMLARFGRPEPTAQATRTYATAGQRAVVTLADGSRVTLAPQSILRAESEFGAVTRTVTLSGEALFEVANRSRVAFVVRTGSVSTRVIGTKFDVRRYPGEPSVRVVVEDGKVVLSASGKPSSNAGIAVLTAKMLGQATDSTVTVTSNVDVNNYIGWAKGRLVFNEAPLRQVVVELARAYDVNIRIADTVLAQQPMTLRVPIDSQSVAETLELIAIATNAHFNRVGDAFVLSPGRTTTRKSKAPSLPQLEKQHGR